MNKKGLIIGLACVLLAGFYGTNLILKKNTVTEVTSDNNIQKEDVKESVDSEETIVNKEEKTTEKMQKAIIAKDSTNFAAHTKPIKKGNMYDNLSNNTLPLSAITAIADLPSGVKNAINGVINSSDGIYMLKRTQGKVLLVVDNQKSIRHGIEFVEISTQNGQQKVTTLGYLDKMKDSNNENWTYDNENRPVKHIIYDKEGDVSYIETWNYSDSSPIKYEIKDKDGKVVSIKKESLDNDSNDLRVDHITYDSDGNTKVKVSATYEGADIKRFTYYNADKLNDSASVFGEYQDGKKVKETVYSSNLKVKNVYSSEYDENGDRTGIKVFDNKNNEVEEIIRE